MGGVFMMFFMLWQNGILAQHHEHDHDHSEHHQKHPKNEIGLGNYLSYLAGEKEIAYSMHIHYLRAFEETRLGAGIGYEHIFDEHGHQSLTVIGTYRITSPLIFSLAPGIIFRNPENPAARFVLHMEVTYEIEVGSFHLGPSLEFATTFDEYHMGLGLHVAWAF
jgi:hypothetical protein